MDTTENNVVTPARGRSVRLARWLTEHVRPRLATWTTADDQLWFARTAMDRFGALRNPLGVTIRRLESGPVRGWWVHAGRTGVFHDVLLYLHGGGFVLGSPQSHFGVAKRMSAAGGFGVFLLDYRLAPEHVFPAAAVDSLAAYRMLLANGYPPAAIVVAGDGAGGHLVASLLNDLARTGLPMPAAAAMFSPVLDLSANRAAARDAVSPDPLLPVAFLRAGLEAYLDGASPTHYRLAVLDADKSSWPPILIQATDTECLLGDARALADALADAGRPHELRIWPGQVHAFQLLARLLPEARAALTHAARYLRDHTRVSGT